MRDLRRLLMLSIATSMILSSGVSQAQQKPARPAAKASTTSRAEAVNAQTRDPFVGVWKLSAKKSQYESGGVPNSFTRTYEDRGGGTMFMTTDIVTPQLATRTYLVYRRDGKPYPEARAGVESISLVTVRAIDPRNEDLYFVVDGKASPSKITISPDGMTMTQVVNGKNAKGKRYTNTLVFDKQR